MGNIYPKVRKGRKEHLNTTPIIEGQFLATTDTKEVFIDIEQTRIQISTFKPGEGDFVRWEDVNRQINPYGKIPFVQSDGVMEIGRYIDFHISEDENDFTQRIQCNESGLVISGTTEGDFKGSLEGKSTSSGISDKVKDAGDQRELTFNYSANGLEFCEWLAAWNGGELRAIAASKFMLAESTDESGNDVKSSITYFKGMSMDCWDETYYYSLHSSDSGPTFTLKDIEDGYWPSNYSNGASLFMVYVTASSSSSSGFGSEDQRVLWIIYYKTYSDTSSKVGKWKRMTVGSSNDRKDAEGNAGPWRFSFVSHDDYDRFAIKVNKGSWANVDIWQMR